MIIKLCSLGNLHDLCESVYIITKYDKVGQYMKKVTFMGKI